MGANTMPRKKEIQAALFLGSEGFNSQILASLGAPEMARLHGRESSEIKLAYSYTKEEMCWLLR